MKHVNSQIVFIFNKKQTQLATKYLNIILGACLAYYQ